MQNSDVLRQDVPSQCEANSSADQKRTHTERFEQRAARKLWANSDVMPTHDKVLVTIIAGMRVLWRLF